MSNKYPEEHDSESLTSEEKEKEWVLYMGDLEQEAYEQQTRHDFSKYVNDKSMAFRTTEEEVNNIGNIVVDMIWSTPPLDMDFISHIVAIAVNDQGAYDLMNLWYKAKEDPKCRYDLVCDMKTTIAEHND